MPRGLAPIVLGLVLLGTPTAWAGSVCYDEAFYPSVVHLDQEGPFECTAPDYCDRRGARPAAPIPPIALSKPEAVALRPEVKSAESIAQEIGAWTEHGGIIWFGVSFYEVRERIASERQQ